MSSTKRGRARQRADTYPTPPWAIKRILEAINLPHGRWLEPCAGDGAVIKAVTQNTILNDIDWVAIEIRKNAIRRLEDAVAGRGAVLCTDFLAATNLGQYEVAITNPPFLHAMEFVTKCREVSKHVVMLLRLNFVSSETRAEFMRSTKPDIYVLPNRPSFVGAGKTDSIEYAWFHWHEKSKGRITVLPSTPKEERRGR